MNSALPADAPDVVAVLEKATFPLDAVNASLAYMADNKVDTVAAAREFLKTNKDFGVPGFPTKRAQWSKPACSKGGNGGSTA